MQQAITYEQLEKMEKRFAEDRANKVAMNAVTGTGVLANAKRPEAFRTDLHQFSLKIDQGDITNQKSSGRCWMFAALNTMRFEIMKKLNLDTFELSQNYTLFYDKLEKANYFLENILETLDEKEPTGRSGLFPAVVCSFLAILTAAFYGVTAKLPLILAAGVCCVFAILFFLRYL